MLRQFDIRDAQTFIKRRKGEKCHFLLKSDVKGDALRQEREGKKDSEHNTPQKENWAETL